VTARLSHQRWVVAGAAGLAVAGYVGLAAASGAPGFPLDDGWIHQTYARNLAREGSWAFVPGMPSAGSTAPLWTLLLVPAYLLSLPPLAWTFLLGAVMLAWIGWAAMALWRALWPERGAPLLAGLAVVLAWPLVWAAGSGMETLLFAALGLTLAAGYVREGARRAAWLGLGAGLLVLVRPEGLILAGLIAAGLASERAWRAVLRFAALMLVPLLPYFALNAALSGTWWPNTFYAKQTEYAVLLAQPLWQRVLRLFYASVGGPEGGGWRGMSGARLLLTPGLLWAAVLALRADWRAKRLVQTIPLLWAAGHVGAYALRLPVTYQHGRYLLAIVPVWIVFGLHGWMVLLAPARLRLVRQVAALSYAVIVLFFVMFGAQAYATDVAFIEGEMVATARWLREHTPADAVVAAHDIGALGFYGERQLLDLAGLVSPEIVPFLNDEAAMADYVRRSEAVYLVTAPGWPYREITTAEDAVLVYETGYEWTRAQGVNNMAVYRLGAAAE
jgi:hypothetical protein